MPLLARMIMTPVVVDVRPGALNDLPELLADQRISTSGKVAVAVGPTSGTALLDQLRPQLQRADCFTVDGGTVDAALALAAEARTGSYDAIVGVGGGRVLDATKFAAARLGLPMVAVATNLAHDGIASPVSALDNDAGRGSYGVPAPIGIVIDLDLVRRAPERSVRAGVGETLSNFCALADWELARTVQGEQVDGLAATLARSGAEAVLHHPGSVTDQAFLPVLAESLVLSGVSMVVAGTSRPCSGACHEISHAIDVLFPERSGYHGEQVGLGAAFAAYLRDTRADGAGAFDQIAGALRRHGLPLVPDQLGLTPEEFARVVAHAPDTRPGRYTVLEHLAADEATVATLVREYVDAVDR